ncbi:hypothetical protein F2P81_020458 [Scophthalmus maximus]|uniref:Uncharacterized protein n=1 Tax=Scophthalmus maximus TaxID=52904 RepID=A0A6A4S3V8_SCOMX|nr:hypothetical protein F2P81_020458 [Scophthalmus maximus]
MSPGLVSIRPTTRGGFSPFNITGTSLYPRLAPKLSLRVPARDRSVTGVLLPAVFRKRKVNTHNTAANKPDRSVGVGRIDGRPDVAFHFRYIIQHEGDERRRVFSWSFLAFTAGPAYVAYVTHGNAANRFLVPVEIFQ